MPVTPKFEKSPPELVARFESVLERVGRPDTTRRQMFGYPWVREALDYTATLPPKR